jgi:hypothetical protein
VTKNLALFIRKPAFEAPRKILRFAAFGGSLRMTKKPASEFGARTIDD